ncbi:MAG TPA: hypothetical protein EYG85_09565 [Crocinitomix sp.]|nr:hypothetical protein [Crocinitomix sp.]
MGFLLSLNSVAIHCQDLGGFIPQAFVKNEMNSLIVDSKSSEVTTWRVYDKGSETIRELLFYKKIDSDSNVIEYSNSNNDTILFIYNKKGDWIVKLHKNNLRKTNRYLTYDQNDNVTKYVIDGDNFLEVNIHYDSLNRPILKEEGSTKYTWIYDFNGNPTLWQRFVKGELMEERIFTYNSNRKCYKANYYYNNKIIDSDSVTFFVDKKGAVVKILYDIDLLSSKQLMVSEYFYDDSGKLVGANINGVGHVYKYDSSGLLVLIEKYASGNKLIERIIYERVSI